MKARLWLLWMGLGVVGLLVLAVRATPARASGVVGTGSPASCTETALDTALAGGGTVTFFCGGPVTITFTTEKFISANTTIDGANGGQYGVEFSGANARRLFRVTAPATLTLMDVTLRNGYALDAGALLIDPGANAVLWYIVSFRHNTAQRFGGAIGNYGTLTVRAGAFYSNTAGVNGGAIDSTGTLDIAQSHFKENWAGIRGGAINNYLGTVRQTPNTVWPTLFEENSSGGYGGALVNDEGTLTLTATFQDNRSSGAGGAFKNSGVAQVTGWFSGNVSLSDEGGAIWNNQPLHLTRSTFIGNRASNGGAITSSGPLTISQSLFSSNSAGDKGGALYAVAGMPVVIAQSLLTGNRGLQGQTIWSNGGLSVDSSTFHGNGFAFNGNGGAIETWGSLRILNSTFAANAGNYGGAILMYNGTIAITNSTFLSHTAGSNGGTLYFAAGLSQSVRLVNTVIGGGSPNNCAQPVVSSGGNADSGSSCGFNSPSDFSNLSTSFMPLGNFGGAPVGFDAQTPLLTLPPALGSPLINSALLAACPLADQRGVPRPIGAGCDIGAVELRPPLFLPLIYR